MNNSSGANRILIITPVRNEEKYLPKTIESVLSQSIRPTQWIIVDDGSSDETYTIANNAAQNHEWIIVHRRKNRGYRRAGGGIVEAFYSGLDQVEIDDFYFVGKIDGDIVIGPDYLEKIVEKFHSNPLLGIASGWIKNVKAQLFAPVDGVRIYRIKCFKEIGGIVNSLGHETIDVYSAMKKGWETKVFLDDALKIDLLRTTGSSQKGILHGRFRDGQACYYASYHPLYFLAHVIKHCMHYPYIIGGAASLWGYVKSWLTRKPRHGDAEFRKFVRRFQVKLLLRAFINPFSNKR